MSLPNNGPNTLQITTQYINYYVTGGTTLKSNSGKIILATDYFMVIPTTVSQGSCTHTLNNYVVQEATCTVNGESIEACTTCGLIKGRVTTTASHAYGDWVVTDSTCTTEGVRIRTCSKCSNKESQIIPFAGHNYSSKSLDPTCVEYKRIQYTCTNCGNTYSEYADCHTRKFDVLYSPLGLIMRSGSG